MQNITIGRYRFPETAVHHEDGSVTPLEHSGWIEGTREDGSTWILFLDQNGSPDLFWGARDADGGVQGQPMRLVAVPLDWKHLGGGEIVTTD